MMNGTAYAKRIFVHYITMLMEAAGLRVDGDTRAEIETAVDNIMLAASAGWLRNGWNDTRN